MSFLYRHNVIETLYRLVDTFTEVYYDIYSELILITNGNNNHTRRGAFRKRTTKFLSGSRVLIGRRCCARCIKKPSRIIIFTVPNSLFYSVIQPKKIILLRYTVMY